MAEPKPENKKPTRRRKAVSKRVAPADASSESQQAVPADVSNESKHAGASAPVSHSAAARSSMLEKEEETSTTPTPVLKRPSTSKKSGKRSTMVLLVVALAVVALVASFVSIRWLIHDDAKLIQGEWRIEASQETLVFNDREMKLTKSVTYEYSLDTFDKVITYSFTNLQGEGNYYFSLDGKTLVITEGDAPNILVQLGVLPNPAIAVDSVDDRVIVLTKLSDNVDATPAVKAENNSTKEADTVGADIVAGNDEPASED